MEKRTSAFARILAALALVVAVVAVVVAISGSLGEDTSNKGHHHSGQTAKKQHHKQRTKAATYEVQEGDTLITIAHKTGVPVAEIEALNPEIDPQILTVGETLKLR